jgi:hypothetical protein
MTIDFFGPDAKRSPLGGVELAGTRQWVRSLLVLPVLFVMVVVVCALAGLKSGQNWLIVLVVMSALTIVFEVLLLQAGAPSLVVSPVAVVRRAGRHTVTVRAEEVNEIVVRQAVNGPVMVIATGHAKVGVPLPSAYREPAGRAALASFLRLAGVDLVSLRSLGFPVAALPPKGVAGPVLSRPALSESALSDEASLEPGGDISSPLGQFPGEVEGAGPGNRHRPSVRVSGRTMAWITLAALTVSAAVGLLRLLS